IATSNRESVLSRNPVDRALDLEQVLAPQPGEGEVQQLPHGLTLMVPPDLFVEVPPYPLERIAFRAAGHQEVQLDPITMVPEIDLDLVAIVALRVVADDVDLAIPAQPAPQISRCAKNSAAFRPCFGLPSGSGALGRSASKSSRRDAERLVPPAALVPLLAGQELVEGRDRREGLSRAAL